MLRALYCDWLKAIEQNSVETMISVMNVQESETFVSFVQVKKKALGV